MAYLKEYTQRWEEDSKNDLADIAVMKSASENVGTCDSALREADRQLQCGRTYLAVKAIL